MHQYYPLRRPPRRRQVLVSLCHCLMVAVLFDRITSGNAFTLSKTQNSSNGEEVLTQTLTNVSSSVVHAQDENLVQSQNQEEEISTISTPSDTMVTATIYGLRVEDSPKPVSYDGFVSVILADKPTEIRLFGSGFTVNTMIRFVTVSGSKESDCDDFPSTKSFSLDENDLKDHSATATIQLPPLDVDEVEFYVCVKEIDIDMPWIHQGTDKWLVMRSYEKWLPLWTHITILVVLLVLSGLFSGLNLGLMAIDRTDLKIIENTGTENERRYARKIQPLRNTGNYLLCSLLLGNVMVNSSLTILLDDLTSGLIAVIGSTLGIVIFGEIIPQAFCSRHGLAVGAHTVWLTKLTMAITAPLSYPVSFILDKILGEEIGNVYNRERLRELIRVTELHNDLKTDEVNVIEGVLKLGQCTCADVMTKLSSVFMLPLSGILDFFTINEIITSGYSRIPIYEGEKSNVVSILYTKDLAFVDPDDRMPLKSLLEFYQYKCYFVDGSKKLDALFREFKEGNQGHMAFVREMHTSENSDPYYEVVGVVTLEDVIEELIQAEISDETDIRSAINRNRKRSRVNELSAFIGAKGDNQAIISPQLTLATFQFLSTTIPAFSNKFISSNILQRLLGRDVFFKIKLNTNDDVFIYKKGVPADYFVLILEGRVQASLGQENLVFEGGPFTYFGTQSLNPVLEEIPGTPKRVRKLTSTIEAILHSIFVPDYTVQAVTDVTYLKISRSMYLAATQATTLEQTFTPDNFAATADVGHKFDEQIGHLIRSNGVIKGPGPYTNGMGGGDASDVSDIGQPTNVIDVKCVESQSVPNILSANHQPTTFISSNKQNGTTPNKDAEILKENHDNERMQSSKDPETETKF